MATPKKKPEYLKKRGRKEKIIDLDKVEKLAKAGATDSEIAKEIGIDRSNLHRHKKKDKELRNTLKDWKDEADKKVEHSLYQRACGITDADGKYYPPDTTAMIFWLKNRQPKNWRDKRDVEMSGGIKVLKMDATDEKL